MSILIVYKTMTGTTRQYAEWLAESLSAEAKAFKETSDEELKNCEACVVMSGTYIGRTPLSRFLKKKWRFLEGKKVAVVAVGTVEPEHAWSQRSYKRIPEAIRNKINYWKLPGVYRDQPVEWGEFKRENLEPVIEYMK